MAAMTYPQSFEDGRPRDLSRSRPYVAGILLLARPYKAFPGTDGSEERRRGRTFGTKRRFSSEGCQKLVDLRTAKSPSEGAEAR